MASQSVARATGDDTQRRISMHQRPRHLVHSPVATNGNDDIGAILGCRASYFGSMTTIFRKAYLVVESLRVHHLSYLLRDMFLAGSTRNGVDDEYDAFFCTHLNAKLQKTVGF